MKYLISLLLAVSSVLGALAQHQISISGTTEHPPVKYNTRVGSIISNIGEDAPINVKYAISVFDRIMGPANMAKVRYIKAPMDTEGRSFIDWISGDVGTYDVVDQPTFTPYKYWEGHPTADDTEVRWDNFISPPQDNVSYSVMLMKKESRATDNHRVFTAEDGSHIEEDNLAGNVQYRAHGVGASTWSGGVLKDTALYTSRRTSSTTQALYENSTLVDSDAVSSQATEDGTFILGNNGTHAREHNGRFGFVVIGLDYDLPTLVKAIHAYLTIISYSPEAQEMIHSSTLDTLSVEPWRRNVASGIADRWQNNGLTGRTVRFNRYGMVSAERSLTDWITGAVSDTIGSPLFVQSLGWQTSVNSAINTELIPSKSPEDLTYILMGRILNNPVNENYLMGADDGTAETYIKVDTEDDSLNFVAKVHTTGLLGYWDADWDTSKIISASTRYPDQLFLRIDGETIRTLSRSHVGIPQRSIYVGGNNDNGTLTEGSEFIAEYFIVLRGEVTSAELDSVSAILNWASTEWQANAPVGATAPEGDNTAPTTPAITYETKGTTFISFDITTPSTDANAFHYNVELNQTFAFTVPQGTTNVIVSGLTPNTENDIRINAEDGTGNISAYSNEITQTTNATGGGPDSEITLDFEGTWLPLSDPPWDPNYEIAPTVIDDPTEGGTNDVLELVVETPVTGIHTGPGARQEYEYRKRTLTGIPPTYVPDKDRIGVRWRIYIPNDHDWDDFSNVIFHQWHHQAKHPVSNGVPISIRFQDEDSDGDGDIKARLRWDDTRDANGDPNPSNNTVTDVTINAAASADMVKGTWYWFVMDFIHDPESTGGTGFLKLYMSSDGTWPDASDIIINYAGPLGFVWTSTIYLKIGMYAWATRNATRAQYMRDNNIDQSKWYLDDVKMQYGETFLSE